MRALLVALTLAGCGQAGLPLGEPCGYRLQGYGAGTGTCALRVTDRISFQFDGPPGFLDLTILDAAQSGRARLEATSPGPPYAGRYGLVAMEFAGVGSWAGHVAWELAGPWGVSLVASGRATLIGDFSPLGP